MTEKNPYSDVNSIDLHHRYLDLIKKYSELAVDIAPKLEKFGKYGQELQIITQEFVSRGIDIKDPDPLLKLFEEELQKRDIK